MYAAGEGERSAVAADNNIAISFWGITNPQRALRKIKRKERQRERETLSCIIDRSSRAYREDADTKKSIHRLEPGGGRRRRRRKRDRDGKFAR